MRSGAPGALYAGAAFWRPLVSSWQSGELLSAAVPIIGGTYNEDDSSDIPDSVTFTVPRWVDGFDWRPTKSATHPLASNGQEVVVSIIATSTVTLIDYETRFGVFQIQDYTEDDGLVTVTAAGQFKHIADDQPSSPLVPRSGGTFASEMRRIVPAGMGVDIDGALTDRAVPSSIEYGDDRLAILTALAEAWPARIYADENGQLRVVEPLADIPDPVLSYVNGVGGTLIKAPAAGSRDGIFNRIIVRAADTDGSGQNPLLAVVDQTSGPYAVDTFGVKSQIWSSPFVTTTPQATNAGTKRLAKGLRAASTVDVEIVPDPRAQRGDAVYANRDGDEMTGYVIAAQHPLTNKDGPSKLKVGLE